MGKKPKCIKAVGYVRVSTGKQDLSLEAQEERLRAYCAHAGLDLVEVIRERAITGKIKLAKRPEGHRVAELLQAGVCHVVTVKLDRMFRNAADALIHVEEWHEAGIAFHLVDFGGQSINTGSSIGKMILTMLAGFAEFERNLIAERTTAALGHLRKSGKVYNHIPYGYRAEDSRLVPEPTEQAVIARMAALRSDGISYSEIANTLNAEGVPTKRNGTWGAQTVYNICGRR